MDGRQQNLLVLYLISVLGLAAVGIWDATNIIYEFMYDNRVTAVRQVNVLDSFPFLVNPVFCIYYEETLSVFPGQADQAAFYKSLITFMRNDQIDIDLENISAVEMELTKNLYQLFVAHHVIKNVDVDGPSGIDKMARDMGIDRSELSSLIDRFLGGPEKVNLTKVAWTEAQQAFLGGDGAGTISGMAELYYIDFKTICIKMSLTADLNPINRSIAYGMDGIYVGTDKSGTTDGSVDNSLGSDIGGRIMATDKSTNTDSSSISDKTTSGQTSTDNPITKNALVTKKALITTTDKTTTPSRVRKHKRDKNGIATFFSEAEPIHTQLGSTDIVFKTNMEIFIFNNAVLDSSRFKQCTPDHDTEEECYEELRLSILAKLCKCAPFSQWMRPSATKAAPNRSDRICTVEDYKQCWNKAMMVSEKVRKKAKCSPCIGPKNRYQFLQGPQYEGLLGNNRNGWQYQTFFVVKCEDKKYLLFEEKPQFSVSQFISQIGGDLGLYVGFSMLGVLQLILLGYQIFGRGRRVDTGHERQENSKTWTEVVQDMVRNSLYGFDKMNSIETENEIKKLQEKMEANERALLDKIKALEGRLDRLS